MVEGVTPRDVVDQEGTACSSVVGPAIYVANSKDQLCTANLDCYTASAPPRDRAEGLLARSVPDLQPQHPAFLIHVPDSKILLLRRVATQDVYLHGHPLRRQSDVARLQMATKPLGVPDRSS